MLEISEGTTFNVDSIAVLNSNISATGSGTSFSAVGVGVNVGDIELEATAAASIQLGMTSFDRTLAGENTAFLADGTGSEIVASAMNSISNNAGAIFSATTSTNFIATNGGLLDLSNVVNVDGGSIQQFGNTQNHFQISSGGMIDFMNLNSIGGRNLFTIDTPLYTLPSLINADGLIVNLAIGTSLDTPNLLCVDQRSNGFSNSFTLPIFSNWQAPLLTVLNDTVLDLTVGSTLSAPSLTEFRNSSVTLEPGIAFNFNSLLEIDDSQIAVVGGQQLTISDVEFNRTLAGENTAFLADGTGSEIVASAMNSISNNAGAIFSATTSTNFIATNGGLLDLSNVVNVDGGSIQQFGTTQNQFSANILGTIEFGNAFFQNRNFLTAENGTLISDGMMVNDKTFVSVSNLGTLFLRGSLFQTHTVEANFDIENGIVVFQQADVVGLEIGSENLGLRDGGLDNFAFRQLAIGDETSKTTLVLSDFFDNGNRIGGSSEIQYLLDINGEGLILNHDSRLVLNGNDVFVSNGTDSFFSIRDLVPVGENSVQFDDGEIALTEDVGTVINGGFSNGLAGFNSTGQGTAEIVESPMIAGNSVLELSAGSAVEVTQHISLPAKEFSLSLDAFAVNGGGTLQILLDGSVFATLDAAKLGLKNFETVSVTIDDPTLLGKLDVPFTVKWDGQSGDQLLIDNLVFGVGQFVLGDVNCDGDVNLLDVAPFVDLLTSGLFSNKADINQDGEVNLLDVAPFVALLTGG